MKKNCAYVTREGKVIECTKEQALSYYRKGKALTFRDMLDSSSIFMSDSMYKFLQKIKEGRR